MSQFLNLSEYRPHQPGMKFEPTCEIPNPIKSNVCVCCLDLNGPFVELGTCAHSHFINTICCLAPDLETMVACRLCHSMLSKIDMFKKQVEQSYHTLTQVKHLDQSITSQLKLNRQINNLNHSTQQSFIVFETNHLDIKVEPAELAERKTDKQLREGIVLPTDFLDLEFVELSSKDLKYQKFDSNVSKELDKSINNETITDQQNAESSRLENDTIKVEIDFDSDNSDLETNMPLSEFQKETQKSETNVGITFLKFKKELKGIKVEASNVESTMSDEMTEQQSYLSSQSKSASIQEKYKDKARAVILTMEELTLERQAGLDKLKPPYKCLDCVRGYEFEVNLIEHQEKFHTYKPGDFQCEICKCCFEKDWVKKRHYLGHFTRYECVQCEKRYNTLRPALAHADTTHRGRDVTPTHTCQQCDATLASYRALRYHMSKHRARVACSECGKSFVNNPGLKKHILLVHKDSSPGYKCEPCNKTYKTRIGLRMHNEVHHGATTPVAYCDTCNTQFKTERHLQKHLRNHSKHKLNDKKFVCAECGQQFQVQRSLDQHVNLIHLRKYDFYCTLCDKAFIKKQSLKRHQRFAHDKEAPPKNKICDYCGVGFAYLRCLKAHIRRHTGERPLSCDICGATFAFHSSLYTHRKLRHKVLPRRTKGGRLRTDSEARIQT